MARLIDADALKEKIEQSGGEGTMARYCKRVLAECLDNDAPTVDAIPVEWLKTQINEALDDNETELASDIGWLIRKYMNEQEAHGT